MNTPLKILLIATVPLAAPRTTGSGLRHASAKSVAKKYDAPGPTVAESLFAGPTTTAAQGRAEGESPSLENRSPVVSAGRDVTVTLLDRVTLAGTVSDDGIPHPLRVQWSRLSGPAEASFEDPDMARTTATFSAPGTYVLELSATDTARDSSGRVTVVVQPPELGAIIRVPADHATIQDAIDAARDGDAVLVSPGRYEENLVLAGKTILLASEFLTTRDSSLIARTILDGGGATVIDVRDSVGAATRILGFTIQNGDDGISAKARLQILNNRFVGNGDAIDYEKGGGVCRDNLFESNSDDGIDLDGPTAATIEHNIIRNNRDDGIEIRLHAYTGPTLQIVIRNNIISGNGEDGIQIIDYPDRSDRVFLIERNLIAANGMAGLGLMDNGRTQEDFRAASVPESIRLVHNTFLDNDHGVTGGANLVALNNVFAGSSRIALKGVNGDSIASYNLFWNNGTDSLESHLVAETSVFQKDPMLDTRSRPQNGSPTIDAGTPSFPSERVALDDAFSGAAPDIGAFESNFTAAPRTRATGRAFNPYHNQCGNHEAGREAGDQSGEPPHSAPVGQSSKRFDSSPDDAIYFELRPLKPTAQQMKWPCPVNGASSPSRARRISTGSDPEGDSTGSLLPDRARRVSSG